MRKVDPILFACIIVLMVFGLLMIFEASSVTAQIQFHDKFHYIKDQLIYTALGICTMIGFSLYDYKKLHRYALVALGLALLLLVCVFIPGIGVYALGAHRWVNARVVIIQPAEFVKLSLAIYLGAWFSRKEKKKNET